MHSTIGLALNHTKLVKNPSKPYCGGIGKPRTGRPLTHLITHLEKELGIEAPIDVKQACTTLDKYHISIRYPDAWVEGVPEYYFTESDARDAINKALLIIEWVEETWRKVIEGRRIERESIKYCT